MKASNRLLFCLLSASSMLCVPYSFAASASWNRNGNGNWSTSSNWTPNTIPNAAGDQASFTNNITANRIVTLTSNRTVGVLNIGDADATHSFTIADNGNNNALIFDNDGNGAQLNETGTRRDTIGASINLLDNLTIHSSGSLEIDGTISGDFGITKAGSGVILLSSFSNTFTGGITINQGEVSIGHENAFGTGNIKLNGGTIALLSTSVSLPLGSGDGQLQVAGGISGFSGSYGLSLGDIVWGSTHFSPTELVLQSNFARLDDIIEFSSNIDLGGANRIIRSDQQGGSAAEGYGSFTGNITGSGKLTKVGIGEHIFQGINTYNGGTDINEGILSFDHIEAMPVSGTVTVKTGATLGITVSSDVDPYYWTMGTSGAGSLGGLLSGLGGQTGSNVIFQGDAGLMLNVYDESTYSGTIGNAGATNLSLLVNNLESGSLTLSGNNTYSGATHAIQGRLIVSSLANAGVSSSIGAYATAGPSGLLLAGGNSGGAIVSYTGGTVMTNRGFTLLGSATIEVASPNVALTMGDFQIQQSGILSITGGTGSSVVLGNTALATNNLNILAEIPVQIGHVEVAGAARTISNYGSAPLTLGSMELSSNVSLQGNLAEITGSIIGTGSLTKNGDPSVLTLSHSNTYSGGTTITQGTLLANNTSGSATGSGSVNVGISSTLGGNGAISGTVYATGKLAPGTNAGNIGNLAVGNTFWNGNATKMWEFDLASASGSSDVLSITGDFSKGTGTTFKFDFMGSSPDSGGNIYTLATWTGLTTFAPENFSYQGLTGSFNSGTFSITANSLQFTTVPEPSGALVGILLSLAGLRRRR